MRNYYRYYRLKKILRIYAGFEAIPPKGYIRLDVVEARSRKEALLKPVCIR